VARQYKFTDALVKVIVKHLRQGMSRADVSKAIGVGKKTFWNWMHDPVKMKPGFAAKVEKAEAQNVSDLLDTIRRHGDDDWRAAAWALERTRPEFGLKARRSSEAQAELDRLAVEKAEADLIYVRVKTDALKKNALSPEQILELLEESRAAAREASNKVH